MKVITQSTPWKRVIRCHTCGAELEIEEKDLKVYDRTIAYDDNVPNYRLGVVCVECQTVNLVARSKVREDVVSRVAQDKCISYEGG